MRRNVTLPLLMAILMLLTVGAVYAAVSGHSHKRIDGERSHPALRVSGHVVGLFPGAKRKLRVRISNRSRRALTVTALRVRVSPGRRKCPPKALSVGRFRHRLVVPGKSSRRVTLSVALRASAPDACQRARFPLRFYT